MAPVEQNYFTCTLGHAVDEKRRGAASSFKSVLDLIDEQAVRIPESPALGIADFLSATSSTKCSQGRANNNRPASFLDLHNLSHHGAHLLSKRVAVPKNPSATPAIGLRCTTSIDFVVTWLGLMRLGFSVLLIAPQLGPEAIRHLCATLGIDQILSDERCRQRMGCAIDGVAVLDIPDFERIAAATLAERLESARPPPDIAFFFHTSGTSSGLPKPIPQSQAVVTALPYFREGRQPAATFTSTPLYHGGLADCLRAWASGALTWFFPEGAAPVTGSNLKRAIEFARESTATPVGYFSSVPFVLQMLCEDDDGISLLRSMNLVGVGGADLPTSVGDRLVANGVNLLSRFGSAECGFLMSSHREYSTDKEWKYLRPVCDSRLLSLEPRENGLSELVVLPLWPFRSKTNREDGSYATSDLFEPHPAMPGRWRYHSRADAQITLANGKKFDPAPLEGAIVASSHLVRDVLVFGGGRDYAGILLFPSTPDLSEKEVLEEMWPRINEINGGSPSHARIARPMAVVVPVNEREAPLKKSSKGTILRQQAEEKYADAIVFAYERRPSQLIELTATDQDLSTAVFDCFVRVLGRRVDPDADLYQQGVDSLSCLQIRKMLESTCLPAGHSDLPMNVLYDQGTVAALVKYICRIRRREVEPHILRDGDEDRTQVMQSLAEKYSSFDDAVWKRRNNGGRTVVLTGATGFLGAHILHSLRQDTSIKKVICLSRAQTHFAAHERVTKSLSKRGVPGLDAFDVSRIRGNKVVCLPADFRSPSLGLSDDEGRWVRVEATVLIHSAWTVNFALRLASFEDQIAGTRNLIGLATEAGARFVFVSSTASVSSSRSAPVPEAVSTDPADASPLGYSQSKWVAEQLCVAASKLGRQDEFVSSDGLSEPSNMVIVRVGQLCGNESGVWNVTEAYPLMLSTAGLTGCLPDLPGEVLDWLPVELAAQAVIEAVFLDVDADLSTGTGATDKGDNKGPWGPTKQPPPVYHIVNPHRSPSWRQMLSWLRDDGGGPGFEVVSRAEWLRRLEKAVESEGIGHPSQALLGFWKETTCQSESAASSQGDDDAASPSFAVSRGRRALVTMRRVQPLDRERLVKIWRWIHESEKTCT